MRPEKVVVDVFNLLLTLIGKKMPYRESKRFLLLLVIMFLSHWGLSQTLFVDSVNGADSNDGSKKDPFRSLSAAVETANKFTGSGSIVIKVLPGTYVLQDKVVINPIKLLGDTARFRIEALHNPDHDGWNHEKMPVIVSVSSNNSKTLFNHAVGFLIASNNVTIEGLKFLGNPNPAVAYYYPITKEDSTLADLEVTQCMFIGDKEASQIQGAIWAHGPNNRAEHNVFFECRNAMLFFDNVQGFSITHNIIARSYESAFWWTPKDVPFEFADNVIINNENVIVTSRSPDAAYTSPLRSSVIANNQGFVGYWSREEKGVLPNPSPEIETIDVVKKGSFEIEENLDTVLKNSHLHLKPEANQGLKAGIFKQ